MKKVVVLILVVLLVASLVPFKAAAVNSPNPSEILTRAKENFRNYIKNNLKAKDKSTTDIQFELIDGVPIPSVIAKNADIKSGDDVLPVYIPGTLKPLATGETTLSQLKQEHEQIKQKLYQANVYVADEEELLVASNAVVFKTKVKDLKKLWQVFGNDSVRIPNLYRVEDTYSNQLIGADSVWSDPGVDGTGIYVGVVDTGVDYTHPDLGGGWGNKIVAGYDFGDNDSDPMDCHGHGTHVAGIMAADGTIKGVAPKAKIVAAKIVSGCEGSAWGTDIAKAFDYMADPDNLDNGPEGTHPPVTAINMSFGSPYGFVDPFDIEHWAIETCTTRGIFVSLSAGNSYWAYAETFGLSSYGTTYRFSWLPDMASVGAPSITPSAISVAASYNSHATYSALTKMAPTPTENYAYTVGSGSRDPTTALGDNGGSGYSYVNCGLGGVSEFPAGGISGKIALIRRGDYTFLQKVTNAFNADAIGVIIYNNTSGYITMATDGQPPIPAVFISQTDGLILLNYSEANTNSTYHPELGDGTGRVGFYTDTYVGVPQAGDTMVEFSSWGPAPDLSFKPEITAPGGGIFSTVPGGYANYSGTSMAAPHVGAASALVKQVHPNWSVFQLKTALMNTAELILDPATGVPYSPHLAGSGRLDVASAVKTPVIVTHFNPQGEIPLPMEEPYAALGEQPDYQTAPITFTVKLKNYSGSAVTYNVSGTTQTVDYRMRSRIMPGATISVYPSTVTVPANGATFVTVTVDATACTQITWNQWGYLIDYYTNYVEGFVMFIPVDPSIPEIHLPYMGVLGKWNQFTDEDAWDFNPIIDPPADDPYNLIWWWFEDSYIDTWPEITDGSYWDFAGVDFNGNLDRNAIAVNTDYAYLEADFGLLRNAQNVTIEIRDGSGNLVKTIDSVDWMYKDPYMALNGWLWYYDNPWTGQPFWWDGTNENGGPAPDGKYELVIKATPQKMFNKANYDAPHIVEFPVSLDRVAPSTSWTSVVNGDGSVTVSWNATDAAPSSGIWGYMVDWASGEDYVSPSTHSYTIPVGENTSYIYVIAIDNAWNFGFGSSPVLSVNPDEAKVMVGQTATTTLSVSGGESPFTYSVQSVSNNPSGKYSFNGSTFTFTPVPSDADKIFIFTLKVTDYFGRTDTETFKVNVMKLPDVTPPVVTLPTINGIDLNTPDALLQINQDMLTFIVSAIDESGIGRMVVKVDGVVQIDKNNLDPTIYLNEGTNLVEITVYDTRGNYTTKSFKVLKDTKPPTIILPDLPQTVSTSTFTLKGMVLDNASGARSLTINDVPVALTVDGNFSFDLSLTQGINTIKITATDKLGNTSTKTIILSCNIPQGKSHIITLKINVPYITIDGIPNKIDAQGSKPIIKDGRTLLPIRVLIESLGGTVGWDAKEQKVTIALNGHSVILYIGKVEALVDGSKTKLDVAPQIIDNRTYLPLRFISEKLGMVVSWDAATQTITIYYWE